MMEVVRWLVAFVSAGTAIGGKSHRIFEFFDGCRVSY